MCHQSSNGADTSIAVPPQAERNAPIGPVNPQIPTLTSRSGELLWNVVVRIKYADEMSASTPQA
ncbi:MAG: hypothetical protein DMF92_21945 [Acidobacteria bacterium]|nr:MAG: hypothetical protein DMF92_21945 [Acidobacteriota bacterium]